MNSNIEELLRLFVLIKIDLQLEQVHASSTKDILHKALRTNKKICTSNTLFCQNIFASGYYQQAISSHSSSRLNDLLYPSVTDNKQVFII